MPEQFIKYRKSCYNAEKGLCGEGYDTIYAHLPDSKLH